MPELHLTPPTACPDLEVDPGPEPLGSILARWEQREAQERVEAITNLSELLGRVRGERPDCGFLVAAYNGCGDSGSFEYCGFVETTGQAEAADAWSVPDGFVDAAELLGETDAARLTDALDHFPPVGYENNDGGQGVIRIDLATREITVEHGWNVTEVHEDVLHFNLAPHDQATPNP